jgi:hypothetical protein
MGYFTIVHIIALVIFFVLMVLLIFLSLREQNKKIAAGMVFSSVLVISSMAVFSMFVLDKYTKKATLLDITHKRILHNESIMFKGKVKNVGSFEIPQCTLKIKMVSDIMGGTLKGSDVFNPQSGLKDWFTNLGGEKEKNKKPTTIEQEFVIVRDLPAGKYRDFTVFMKYPPYFSKPYFKTEVSCR